MRGRKPKPTEVKRMQGNPGKRPLNQDEPDPEKYKKVPPPPNFLDDVAKTEWRRIARILWPIGLVTKAERSALAAYCVAFSTFVYCNKMIADEGYIVLSENGFPMKSPWVTMKDKANEQMMKWLVEFGATPSARSRVKVKKKEKKNPLSDFLDKGREIRRVK